MKKAPKKGKIEIAGKIFFQNALKRTPSKTLNLPRNRWFFR
jgi:hypothetical protein